MICAVLYAIRDRAEQSALLAAHYRSLISDYYSFQLGNTIQEAIYARGPFGRPPCPSTACMSEESRIESSFGPIRLPYIMTQKNGTTVVLTYSHHVPITLM
jgi:hypothetical protein